MARKRRAEAERTWLQLVRPASCALAVRRCPYLEMRVRTRVTEAEPEMSRGVNEVDIQTGETPRGVPRLYTGYWNRYHMVRSVTKEVDG